MTPELVDIKLGLHGTHQLQNANLAIHLARKFFETTEPADSSTPAAQTSSDFVLPPTWIAALESARWPGRCQSVNDPNPVFKGTKWFLDGAHTVESLDCCAQWFVAPGVALIPGEKNT